ncbi:MAG: Single-stranded DNA-binding protein [Candidatus Woesebacteria bacterium GW2011_GWA1_39_21]|uniref:Single-stranded DNA-binding protein n=1 Tax=Candidatus Woesebacteria bacterium GW2011_GWA1_39_21 TaxID=1618550 RepID=A0A0G0QNI7_9BACT|nr:MAG: Single-stranded DNA-binding protein [Candidatus Woesebacteria bacterium GW2011_GWA1_39_21]
MSRSLNKVELIGNLTRDPELRFTPSGSAVCTFGLATNRQWNTDQGEKKEEVEFHRIVAWNKLAELCGQLLAKGRKVYVEGRLQTRKWTGSDSQERTTTEIVISDMIILDSRMQAEHKPDASMEVPENLDEIIPPVEEPTPSGNTQSSDDKTADDSKKQTQVKSVKAKKTEEKEDGESDDDIPF